MEEEEEENEDEEEGARVREEKEKRKCRLFSAERDEFEDLKVVQLGTFKLRAAEECLFGRKNAVSDENMFALLTHAVMGVDIPDLQVDLQRLLKFSRRQWSEAYITEPPKQEGKGQKITEYVTSWKDCCIM